MTDRTFRCHLVQKSSDGSVFHELTRRPISELPDGNVRVRVHYSSLNYKDAMATTGHPGIVKTFPHIPGIDAAGTVEFSDDPRFRVGDPVIATGHELGVERWGGWAEFVQVPGDWLVPLPTGMTLKESMIIGTAGFTAAQCVKALLIHGITPQSGQIIVSGATGGVGSLSVMLLARLGFSVVAVTGKDVMHSWLKEIGASEVQSREILREAKPRPLLTARFAAGIDTVGGSALATMLKLINHRGCVACCGMAGGADFSGTAYPFILRGIALYGIDSAWCPDGPRAELWNRLATEWKLLDLASAERLVALSEIDSYAQAILQGRNVGRVVIDLA